MHTVSIMGNRNYSCNVICNLLPDTRIAVVPYRDRDAVIYNYLSILTDNNIAVRAIQGSQHSVRAI